MLVQVAVLKLLSKRNARYKFKELVALTKSSNQEVQSAITSLRNENYNITFGKHDKTYYLSPCVTWYQNTTNLTGMPTEGSIGVISDTHLCSVAERLDLVNYAYDTFKAAGVRQVFHAGDVSDGWDEYRGHINFVKVHGSQAQALYVSKHYPAREGITTYAIGGNHDDDFKHRKVDRLSLLTHGFHHEGREYAGREDIVYLGQYSHKLILPQEVVVELLHPRGGNPYSVSYRAQKRSEAMTANERPDLQISGHFHQQFFLWISGTWFCGCPGLQDITEFFVRLGYQRNLGFQILHYRIAKGKFLYLRPQIFMCE